MDAAHQVFLAPKVVNQEQEGKESGETDRVIGWAQKEQPGVQTLPSPHSAASVSQERV